MDHARAKARELRRAIELENVELLDRIKHYLTTSLRISIVPMSREQMNGSRGEIDTETGVLKYDLSLTGEELVVLLAHELGHLVLHARLTDPNRTSDPLLASAYGDAGAAAVARYSPRTKEEAQASAFALEFVCPADAVWSAWIENENASIDALSREFRCTEDVVRVQLAQALHAVALGGPPAPIQPKNVAFTDAQRRAARIVGHPVMVDAGPGTGKTATVIERLRFLTTECAAEPEQILALTFSNEASQELVDRAAATLGPELADAMTIRTFHGFGMEFLHHHGHLLGLREDFRLIDEDAQGEIVSDLLGRVECDRLFLLRDPSLTADRLVEHINYCKHRLIAPDDLERELSAWQPASTDKIGQVAHAAAPQFVGVFRAYESTMRANQRVDFADLIALPIKVLIEHPDVRAIYVEKFPWVIVDEFQDVTRATSALLSAICNGENPPWAVGDARQSIYQFLGAAPENVSEFKQDFPEAEVVGLDVNYRSSVPIVAAANQLATLLAAPDAGADDTETRWRAGTDTPSFGQDPVSIAVARSDAAEATGVAQRVADWIAAGASPGSIAVLARRHVDVRNTILDLKARNIAAQASGLLTADGAAGDLAVLLTLADAPTMSVPRVAFALGRARFTTDQINATIAELLHELRDEASARSIHYQEELAREVRDAYDMALTRRHASDGFRAMTDFLFERSGYLRRILAAHDSAERSMTLIEIVSALSSATSYRATHAGQLPADARIGFAERFRVRLTRTLPIPLAPKPRTDAVHVMTCHASKGLEFPCVVVMGQTLPPPQENWEWLPPTVRPSVNRETQQADSLLFVGVTRARQAVVVSYPERATAGTAGKGKAVVPLLARWRDTFGIHLDTWTTEPPPVERVRGANVWEAPIPKEIKVSALDDSICPLLTYLETILGARFPEGTRELYPLFFKAVRESLRAIAVRAIANGGRVEEAEARKILDEAWPVERFSEHPHVAIYRAAASRMVRGFANAFEPRRGSVSLDSEVHLAPPPNSRAPFVTLDLVACFRGPDGRTVAIAFRPESVDSGSSTLKWSDLDARKRASLVLLENDVGGVAPMVYSGDDERLYDYKWSKQKASLPQQVHDLLAQRDAFGRGELSAEPTKFSCDRCRARAACPHWLGALRKS